MITNNSKLISIYFDKLWPILRSITGDGVRKTHKILKELIPLKTMEIPSGTKVHDWIVPKEWKLIDAYIVDPKGKKICDVKENNLHVINYSIPVNKTMSLKKLQNHLHSIKTMPSAIPYLTSYYGKNWGFCIKQKSRDKLIKGNYKVFINSRLFNGSMTISDKVLRGRSKKEILFTTYTCHPSMANNELSGPLVSAFLYKKISKLKNRYFTYRFVYHPETIGSIAYLSKKGNYLKKNTFAAYNLTCLGHKSSPLVYKRSKIGNSISDIVAEKILRKFKKKFIIKDYYPTGSDERQYCSPGYNLPMGVIMKGVPGKYKQYHTSLDNKKNISIKVLNEMTNIYFEICKCLEKNKFTLKENFKSERAVCKIRTKTYLNIKPFCEPHFSKRKLQQTLGDVRVNKNEINAIKWLLSYSDGYNDIFSISKKSGLSVEILEKKAKECCGKKLLKKI